MSSKRGISGLNKEKEHYAAKVALHSENSQHIIVQKGLENALFFNPS